MGRGGDCPKTKNEKPEINKSGGELSNMRPKRNRRYINIAGFGSKVGKFKMDFEFSDTLGGIL